jgi:hypothetical protein
MIMQNFNSLASTQTDIAKFWTFFQENFKVFLKILKRISKNSKSEYAVFSLNTFNKAYSCQISARQLLPRRT